ncbi:DUF3540 domain-containing protein [Xenorhabdus cabanillasii]|uniref:Uncharacterized protein DUF3540 n=2 Tax=Xenorhabdus cabanillasii TaxID=351673 RepID=A0A3D9UFP4_9GAMM|nr:DUF3540 domain-containing protein [Xenorhabdus cabanillasii]PHM79308.1 lipoprotein [Xenorhabdus cabanillasii JM26]REF28076.1 uncharacterized protein DUF3540 [Xenorhabdus cabanillasii]
MSKPSYALSSPPLTTGPLQQVAGQVVNRLQDGSLMVESNNRGWHCRRAASCLLTPEPGDTVLVTTADGQLWVLAILERPEQQYLAEISVPGDLAISSQGDLSLNSNGLNIAASIGNCHISKMQYSGESLSAWVSITQLIGNKFESVWQTVTQLSNRLFRHTTQTEQVQAGQLDIQAESYIRLHAQNTMMSAKAVAKIDAEQIHIG